MPVPAVRVGGYEGLAYETGAIGNRKSSRPSKRDHRKEGGPTYRPRASRRPTPGPRRGSQRSHRREGTLIARVSEYRVTGKIFCGQRHEPKRKWPVFLLALPV